MTAYWLFVIAIGIGFVGVQLGRIADAVRDLKK